MAAHTRLAPYLFFAYLLMMLTICEQGRTIEAQKMLIRQLYTDSAELTSVKSTPAPEDT